MIKMLGSYFFYIFISVRTWYLYILQDMKSFNGILARSLLSQQNSSGFVDNPCLYEQDTPIIFPQKNSPCNVHSIWLAIEIFSYINQELSGRPVCRHGPNVRRYTILLKQHKVKLTRGIIITKVCLTHHHTFLVVSGSLEQCNLTPVNHSQECPMQIDIHHGKR